LRKAFWAQGRCISMRHVILDVAKQTGAVDVTDLATRMDDGSSRGTVFAQFQTAREDRVICSPHVFLADGTNLANPGVAAHWVNGDFGTGFPVIEANDPSVYQSLLAKAAALAGLLQLPSRS
jgi:hypothetical protein